MTGDNEWWRGGPSDPAEHDKDCLYHFEQYTFECNCGRVLKESGDKVETERPTH